MKRMHLVFPSRESRSILCYGRGITSGKKEDREKTGITALHHACQPRRSTNHDRWKLATFLPCKSVLEFLFTKAWILSRSIPSSIKIISIYIYISCSSKFFPPNSRFYCVKRVQNYLTVSDLSVDFSDSPRTFSMQPNDRLQIKISKFESFLRLFARSLPVTRESSR